MRNHALAAVMLLLALAPPLIAPTLALSGQSSGPGTCLRELIGLATEAAHKLARLGYSPWISSQIDSQRPDVANAVFAIKAKKLNPYITHSPESLPKGFYRENLKPYFKTRLWEPVTLYRGIDHDFLTFDFVGEKRLIWTSEKLEDAIEYAGASATEMRKAKKPHALLIKIEVPRFLVYERSGWPVLRLEDIPDLKPFVRGASKLRLDQATTNFFENHPGEGTEVLRYLKNKQPGIFEETGDQWVPGAALQNIEEHR
ncbi:MAG TPA: hypothetical protein VJB59_02095 [Bdellovibrionota bacterium]|nr:hypothetical protein [Bdellovibrionota bacterium]